MRFSSPWQFGFFIKSVAVVRRILRPFWNLEHKFIDELTGAQNRRVQKFLAKSNPSTVLLIMPRCAKLTECRADVQNSLSQCLECNLCPLGDVGRLCEKFKIRALVAFRSQVAFDLARKSQPDLIIATACHDRLVKALRSMPEYPALLTPLTGMKTKCINAGVDIVWLEGQLAGLKKKQLPDNTLGPAISSAPEGGCSTASLAGTTEGP